MSNQRITTIDMVSNTFSSSTGTILKTKFLCKQVPVVVNLVEGDIIIKELQFH